MKKYFNAQTRAFLIILISSFLCENTALGQWTPPHPSPWPPSQPYPWTPPQPSWPPSQPPWPPSQPPWTPSEETIKIDQPREISFEFKEVLFFEEGAENIPQEQRNYATRFAKRTARNIVICIGIMNHLYLARDQKIEYFGQLSNRAGTLNHETKKQTVTVGKGVRNPVLLYLKTGWDEPGNWPLGIYALKAYMNGAFVSEAKFEIYE